MAVLVLHLEATDDGPTWWAESPEVPGFTAAALSLGELRTLATEALGDGWTEQLDAPAQSGVRQVIVGP